MWIISDSCRKTKGKGLPSPVGTVVARRWAFLRGSRSVSEAAGKGCAPMAYLASIDGAEPSRVLQFKGGECYIGRHPDRNLILEGNEISRQHAKFTFDGTEYFVQDLGARNHTYLNDRQLELSDGPQKLKDGDEVGFSSLRFLFRTGELKSNIGDILFVEDEADSSTSTIMSKVGVSSSRGSIQLMASPEAKLNALLEITRALGRALVLDAVLPQVLNCLFKIFVQADRGFIALQAEDGTLVPRWSRAYRDDMAETIRVSRTIVNRVMETQEGILSADMMSDPDFNKAQSIAELRIRSMMCAPLIDGEGKSMGVLQIDTTRQRKKFEQGDLEVLLAVATQASIAIDNAQLHEQTLRQRVVQRDLELAHEVQHGFLPEKRPDVGGYQFFDYYQPANQVGGDYFDYVPLGEGRVGIVVADVVGKGVAAALLMAKLSAEARYSLATAEDAGQAMTTLNERMCDLNLDRFVTAVLAVLDPERNRVAIANAGHMAPIHRQASGEIVECAVAQTGLPLGIMNGNEYEHSEIELANNESLTMYTDGLNEAVSESEAFYGIERIRQCVRRTSGSPEAQGRALVDDVRAFIGQGDQSDDMCMVTFGRL